MSAPRHRRRGATAESVAAHSGGNALTRWRQRRRLMRESRLLLKESRRILRHHRVRIKEEVAEEVRAAVAALDEARQGGEVEQVRERAERLDELLEKHLSFGRKSALREYAESIGVAVLIALVLRAFVVEAFKIPSGSMIPTLRVGDHIFVNKFIYGLRIPWTNIKFFERKPHRGSVVVFIYPQDPDKDFIKRIVAVGGDTLAVRNNVVLVNGRPVKRKRLDGPCQYFDGDEDSRGEVRSCVAFDEELDGQRYRVIHDVDFDRDPIDFPPTRIPEGTVFVMGDNRDNSHDSRVWGTVPLHNLKGKALIIWWSSGEQNGIRWRRFFNRVHRLPESNAVGP